MNARKQLLAVGSTATLVAGGVFFGAAPASAVHNSADCLAAQSQFTAALHTVELNADLEVELAVALQNLVDAQETLDLLDVEATLTLEDIEAQIVLALQGLEAEQLPNLNAIINAEAAANSAVGQAQAQLQATLDGGALDAAVLLALGLDINDFLLPAELNVATLTAEIEALVTAGDLTREEADALLTVIAGGDLVAITAALNAEGIDVNAFLEADVDRVELEAALLNVIADLELALEDAATARLLAELLASGDLAAILDAEAQLEALLGVDLDFSALINLETELLATLAVLDAQANLDAAIAVVNGLQVQLDALDIDLLELENLFAEAIGACTTGGAGVGVGDDDAHDNGNGAGGTGGAVTTGGGTGGTGGTNRGMNVQTAVSTADTDPAGIGALAAGLGFVVVAGTLAVRRVRSS